MTPRHAGLARLALLPALAIAAGLPLIAGGSLPAAAQEGGAAEAPAAASKGVAYHFGVTEQRTNILFESETTVETIHGITHSVKGKGTFDFEAGTGETELVVPVDSLKTGMEARDAHMYGEDWLDAAKHPEIVLKAKSLKRVKVLDEKAMKETWAYEGTLTIKGKTNDVKGEAQVQRIPDDLGRKLGPGKWLKVKAEFQIVIKDYGIEVPAASAAKVSDVWDIKIDLFATTAEPKAK